MSGAEYVGDDGPSLDAVKGDGALNGRLDADLGRLHHLGIDLLQLDGCGRAHVALLLRRRIRHGRTGLRLGHGSVIVPVGECRAR